MNARAAALLSAVLFSTGGAAVKATSLTGWQVAGFRSLIAACAVALIFPASRRGWTGPAALAGFFYALCLFTFVQATKNTTAANAIFLQSAAPLYLIVLGPLILREKTKRSDWITLGLIGMGMLLVFQDSGGARPLAPNPALGNVYGAVSGAAWAATICGLRWLSRHGGTDAMVPVLIGNLFSIALCASNLWPMDSVAKTDVAAIVYLGIFQVGLAYWLLTRAVSKLSALETALLVMLEPALNPVWTWLVHGERPGEYALAGGALILGATLLKTWMERNDMVI